MKKSFYCSKCNSKRVVNVADNIDSNFLNCDIYVCLDCRHIDLYSRDALLDIANRVFDDYENKSKITINTKNEIVFYSSSFRNNEKEILKFVKRLDYLEKESLIDNYSVKKNKEILDEIALIKEKIKNLENKRNKLKTIINELESRKV